MAARPAGRQSPFERIRSVIRRLRAGHLWDPVSGLDLWQRSLGFAALGFLTLIPLLIVVSAAGAGSGKGFAQWLGDALGVSEPARMEIERLFALPGQMRRTTTAFGLALLAVFGLSFGTVVQSGYEKVWDLAPARWWARWRHVRRHLRAVRRLPRHPDLARRGGRGRVRRRWPAVCSTGNCPV
ncbi:hypothetical protein [Streptomyces zaomyceticus]|uniref:hypothetical protein n=1 Tax=Streptomyces zaomyceticus TaxID=68286 RepID=UPI0038698669